MQAIGLYKQYAGENSSTLQYKVAIYVAMYIIMSL